MKAKVRQDVYAGDCLECGMILMYSDINEGSCFCPRCYGKVETDAVRDKEGSFTFTGRGVCSCSSWHGYCDDKVAWTDLDAMALHDKIVGMYGKEPEIEAMGDTDVFMVYPFTVADLEKRKLVDTDPKSHCYRISFQSAA